MKALFSHAGECQGQAPGAGEASQLAIFSISSKSSVSSLSIFLSGEKKRFKERSTCSYHGDTHLRKGQHSPEEIHTHKSLSS